MSKYIITNCPAKPSDIKATYGWCSTYQIKCQDCTNCLLKQIVELCKDIECPCEYKGADCWECTESGARRFADRILKLIDIEEVE